MNFLSRIRPFYFFAFTFIISGLMHLHVFRTDLVGYHVWRQTQTQLNIENFYREDFNILNPKGNDTEAGDGTLRQEFPIMQWIFACFYKLFGDHLIISRILSFVIGLFSVIGIFHFLRNIFQNNLAAMAGAWAFNFSPVFYYYTMNPLPDNFALCCGIWGIAFFSGWIKENSVSAIILTGIFLSLSALAKLPFILYFVFPFAYFIYSKSYRSSFLLALFMLLPAAWYLSVLPSMGWNPVLYGILKPGGMTATEALDILRFNLISTLPELLINYGAVLFFLAGSYFAFRKKISRKEIMKSLLWLAAALLLYFFFEMNLIAKVHDYYLFPFLPLIFLTVAYGCSQLLFINKVWQRFGLFLLLILPLTAFIRANTRWDVTDPGFNTDLLLYKNELRSAVPDSEKCMVGNDNSKNIYFYYINKKGWAFDNDSLSAGKLNKAMQSGVKYLYSDSRKVDESPELIPFLDSLIDQKGTVRVYKLKASSN